MNQRQKVLSSFTLAELKNKVTFWSVRQRLQNIDKEERATFKKRKVRKI